MNSVSVQRMEDGEVKEYCKDIIRKQTALRAKFDGLCVKQDEVGRELKKCERELSDLRVKGDRVIELMYGPQKTPNPPPLSKTQQKDRFMRQFMDLDQNPPTQRWMCVYDRSRCRAVRTHKPEMRRHISEHLNPKTFSCRFCKKEFSSASGRNQHHKICKAAGPVVHVR